MTPNKWIAVAVIATLTLVANGYSGAVLWTFHYGERTTATVTECEGFNGDDSFPACYGTWIDASGAENDGEIGGAKPADDQIPVRLGPLGAYADRSWTKWGRMWPAAVVDLGLVASPLLFATAWLIGARNRRRMITGANPGSQIRIVKAKRVLDESGVVVMTITRFAKDVADLRSPDGNRLLNLARYLVKAGHNGIRVTRPDGTEVGTLRQEEKRSYGVHDPEGTRIGLGRMTSSDGKGERCEFTADGRPLATVVLTWPVVVRIEPTATADTRTLLLAFGVGQLWFTAITTPPASKSPK